MKKSCFYDKEKCESVVIISENGNCYKGTAKTHPDDKECASKYTGLTIADYRAKIERQKRKIKSAKAELKMINSRKAELENYIKRFECENLEKKDQPYRDIVREAQNKKE